MNNDHSPVVFVDGKGNFSFQIKLSEKRRIDKETGYLYCDEAIFGHTGVQEYHAQEIDKGGREIVKVHRFAEDVFSDEAMASIEGKSVTRLHPNEAVTAGNYRNYDVGTILKVWRDNDNVVGNIVIKDMETIEDIIEHRMESLSLGYRAKLVDLGNGEFKQTDITVNHLAVVERGRAVNARIMDESPNIDRKEKTSMSFIEKLFGRKIRLNDDDTLTIVDEKYVTEKKTTTTEKNTYDTETGESTHHEETVSDVVETKEETSKSESEKKEIVDTEPTTEENDKGEIEMTDEVRKALKDELMKEVLAEFKNNPDFKKSVFEDVVTVDPQDPNPKPQTLSLNFTRDEQLRKAYYNQLTNPVAHNNDWKSFNEFRKKAGNILSV